MSRLLQPWHGDYSPLDQFLPDSHRYGDIFLLTRSLSQAAIQAALFEGCSSALQSFLRASTRAKKAKGVRWRLLVAWQQAKVANNLKPRVLQSSGLLKLCDACAGTGLKQPRIPAMGSNHVSGPGAASVEMIFLLMAKEKCSQRRLKVRMYCKGHCWLNLQYLQSSGHVTWPRSPVRPR